MRNWKMRAGSWLELLASVMLRLIVLAGLSSILLVMLSGCATRSVPVECPQPTPIPESLVSDQTSAVESCLSDFRKAVQDAALYLESLTRTETR